MFNPGPTQAEAKKKKKEKGKKKWKKNEKKKEDKLAFSFRQREKFKPGFKPCSSQWAPSEYTDLDLTLVETTTYFPLNVFLIFCQYLSCIPQRAPYQYIETEGYLVKIPN